MTTAIHTVPNILDHSDAKELKRMGESQRGRSYDFSHSIISRIANTYQSMVDDQELILVKPSYWRVETKPKGHKWHYDGCREDGGRLVDNHMSWCRIGTTSLLTAPEEFTGGKLIFLVDGHEMTIHNHYLNGLMYPAGRHDSPLKHKVEPHKGKRTVLLMFFATKPVSKDQLKGN